MVLPSAINRSCQADLAAEKYSAVLEVVFGRPEMFTVSQTQVS
jgi:hypothetical protein